MRWLLHDGYVEVCRIRGVPIRLHWSFPLGAVLPATFIGFHLLQAIYLAIGYVLLIGIHEAGHAIAARLCRLDVLRVDITGFGGMCWTEAPHSPGRAFWVFSGGLVAQALLLVATSALVSLLGNPRTLFLNCLVLMFTVVNFIILVPNAIPFGNDDHPTDGYILWKLIGEMWRRRR